VGAFPFACSPEAADNTAVNPSTLLVEADPAVRRLMREVLEGRGYGVHEVATAALGLQEAALIRPSAIVLSLELPDLPGLEALRELREWCMVPVLVLCADEGEAEKVTALDAGADDFLVKPFTAEEFFARFHATEHRAQIVPNGAIVTRGDLTVDLTTRRVTRGGTELRLTPTEFALVQILVRHPGRVFTQRQILGKIWGVKANGERPYLPVYVTHLRAKIERDPSQPELIRTEDGIGYRFAAE
jgi:two-component system KDP operon response regulator KdpE